MKRTGPGGICLLTGLIAATFAAGCDAPFFSPDPYARYELGPAKGTVIASIEAIGGLKAWRKVQSISATAVVTIYRDGGEAYVNLQDQQIDLLAGHLHAEAATPRGPWEIDADVSGAADISGSVVDAGRANRLADRLQLRELGVVGRVGQASRPQAVAQ